MALRLYAGFDGSRARRIFAAKGLHPRNTRLFDFLALRDLSLRAVRRMLSAAELTIFSAACISSSSALAVHPVCCHSSE